jgi:putative nucleotidyltransferase with HDIG domain
MLSKVEEFPTLPTIYSTLSEVMANPRSTINDAAEVISKDQAAASKVLKAANSSIYGLRVNIDTITQAIFYIGFEEVKNLVYALSIINIFNSKQTGKSISPVDLWKHSLAVGVISRRIGEMLGIKNLENYFVAGILHDIGKLFFFKYFNDEFEEIIKLATEKNISVKEAEKEILGITHTVVGELLAEKWRLPRNIINAISYHNTGLVNGKIDVLVACVHLADIVAGLLELSLSKEEIVPEPNFAVWEMIRLPNNAFTNALDLFVQDYEQSVNLLLTS